MSENKISITSNNSYAQALFELANEDKSLAKVEEQVVAISRLINESEEFRYLIKNPTTSIEDLTKVIETISEKNNFDNHLKRFLVFLIQKRRFFYLEKILSDFIDVCSKARGEIKAELFSAKELNETDISKIKEELSQNFGAKIQLNYKFDQLLKNFLSFLIQKRRFFFVERILKSFIEICSENRGELKAELRSAKQLSNEEIKQITEELTKNFSSKIKLNYKHDESLIGGLVVQVGSTMVDTSIKSKLQQIENRMIEA